MNNIKPKDMNKLKNILTLGLSVLLLFSCSENFLDVESKTESNTETFYKTEKDAWRALIGCYDGWQCTVSNGGFAFYVASEVMSDECFGGVGHADGYGYQAVDRFDISISPSDLNMFETTWSSYYAGVYRCNELIAHEEQVEWESSHALYMGECRAIRAILYFDMVRFWGNIPLFTEPVNENKEQSDPKEVYKVIFDDLQYAVDSIPSDAYPKSDAANNDGHITQAAAKALMARAYLYYTGYYGEEPEGVSKAGVLQGLEDVIAFGEYSLIPQFKNLWPAASSSWSKEGSGYVQTNTYAGDGNAETVLAQKFNYTQDYNGNNDGNEWLVMMGIRSFVAVPYGYGWGACTVNPEILKNFGTGDTRESASVVDLEGEGITAMDGFDKNSKLQQREYTGYTVKKYTPMAEWRKDDDGNWSQVNAVVGLGEGDFQTSQYQNFVVMRYADVLLMAAELGSSNAKKYLNDVRRRAYTDAEGNLSSSYSEIEATKENILKERMLEFAFEGQRYWDLLRQGIDVAANAIAISNYSVLNGGNAGTVTITASKVKETEGLSQIPNNQITLSDYVLKQNTGW